MQQNQFQQLKETHRYRLELNCGWHALLAEQEVLQMNTN